jgi:hypothetical protein
MVSLCSLTGGIRRSTNVMHFTEQHSVGEIALWVSLFGIGSDVERKAVSSSLFGLID